MPTETETETETQIETEIENPAQTQAQPAPQAQPETPAPPTVAQPRPARMRLAALWFEILAGLLQRPGRAIFTMLGTVLGIGSFVAVTGISATASGQISADFTLLDATTVNVTQYPPPNTATLPFPADTSKRLAQIDGEVAAGRWWSVNNGQTVDAQPALASGEPVKVQAFAADSGALKAAEASLAGGNIYSEFAEAHAARVALVSTAVATQLGITADAVPCPIRIQGQQYMVTGVLKKVPALPQLMLGVVLPAATAQAAFGLPSVNAPASVIIRTRAGAAGVVAQQAPVTIRPDQPKLLTATSTPVPTQERAMVLSRVSGLVAILALVVLIIGAVSIANTTMVSIMERTAEIGLRRALGARTRHIIGQFLGETGVLGAVGGVVGTSLALLVILGVALAQRWTPVVDPRIVFSAPVIAAVVGVLAGLYPSIRASRIEPIEALTA